MKRRSIVALGLVVVLAASLVAATSGATKKATANSITVWLQVDAQSGWPDVVAAANQKFQADHPGTTVNVQYQNWGDHLQKFDATLAGGGGPDVIEFTSSTYRGDRYRLVTELGVGGRPSQPLEIAAVAATR